ncbi:MAG: MAG0480 family ComEC-like protein [Metamycoplasmataceae bacterium]
MRRNWQSIRYWWKNTSILKRKYWSFLNLLLFSLTIIFAFIYLETRANRWIVFISFFIIISLLISWKYFVFLLFFMPSLFLGHFFLNNNKLITKIEGNYKITQVISTGYVINKNSQKILLKTKNIFNIDDLINVNSSDIESLKEKQDQYYYYLKSLGIKYIANKIIISKIDKKTSVRAKILNYLEDGPEFYVNYVSLILLGKKTDLNQNLYEKIKYISILHLFTISGFHINLLMVIILKLLMIFKLKKTIANCLGFILIFLYLYILNFPISSLRAILFLILCFINKEYLKNKFHKINILSFIMLIMFIINPFVVFSLSFIFTFLITFAILFVADIKNKKIRNLSIIFASYFSSIVISVVVNGWLNIFGIINSIIFSPILIINYIITIFAFPFKEQLNSYYIYIDFIINLFYKNSLIVNININNQFIDFYYLFLFSIVSIVKHYNIVNNLNSTAIRRINHLGSKKRVY